jgi:hypothetical protein
VVKRSPWVFVLALAGCSFGAAFDGSSYRCADGRCPVGQYCDEADTCQLGLPPLAADAAPEPVDAAAEPDAAPTIVDAAPDAPPPPPPPDAAAPDAALVAPAACDDDLAVPTGDGGCFVLHTSLRSYSEAAARCINPYGGFIAVITSAQEQAALKLLGVHGIDDVWLGGDDRQDEGIFVWQGGEPVTLDFWAPGEPNNGNANQMGEGQEDCMAAQLDLQASWDDRPCFASYAYVCEHEAE